MCSSYKPPYDALISSHYIRQHYITFSGKLFHIFLLRREMLGRQWYEVVPMVQQVLKSMTSANVDDQEPSSVASCKASTK